MEELKSTYITYEYIGKDERITTKKGYVIIQRRLEKALDIEDFLWHIRTRLAEDYNIEPNDIDPYKDILITYIKEI